MPQCVKVPRPTWSSSSTAPGVLEMRALPKSFSLLRAWPEPLTSSARRECRSATSHVIFFEDLVYFAAHSLIRTFFFFFKQVGFVQYSDDAKTEFKLNTYHDKGVVLSALEKVRYRGGNTKIGRVRSSDLLVAQWENFKEPLITLRSILFAQESLWSTSTRECSPRMQGWGGTSPRCWWWSLMDAPRMTSRRTQKSCSRPVSVDLMIIVMCIIVWLCTPHIKLNNSHFLFFLANSINC